MGTVLFHRPEAVISVVSSVTFPRLEVEASITFFNGCGF